MGKVKGVRVSIRRNIIKMGAIMMGSRRLPVMDFLAKGTRTLYNCSRTKNKEIRKDKL